MIKYFIKIFLKIFLPFMAVFAVYIFASYNTAVKNAELSYKDIMGVSIAKKNGLKVAIVSGDVSPSIDFLAKRFGLEDIHQGVREKLPIVKLILEKYDISQDEAVYLGDDVNDIESLKFAGYSVIPEQANYKLKDIPGVQVSCCSAGDGLFRDVVDNVLEMKTVN